MTDEEAIKKWCPMTRVAAPSKEFSYNRDYDGGLNEPETFCIASMCMMWVPEQKSAGRVDGENIIITSGGFCGLARK